MLASLRSAVNSSCCRCRTLPQQRFHRKLLQSRRGLLTRLQSRKIVAATGPSSDEPPQHGTTQLQPSPASWPHEARTSHVCPACGQRLLRLPVLERHFQKCCPDLISPHVWLSLSARCFIAMTAQQQTYAPHRPCRLLTTIRMQEQSSLQTLLKASCACGKLV